MSALPVPAQGRALEKHSGDARRLLDGVRGCPRWVLGCLCALRSVGRDPGTLPDERTQRFAAPRGRLWQARALRGAS